jgi:hypothetical protein
MTDNLNALPNGRPDPEAQRLWIKHDQLSDRLEAIARKADLLAFAIDGVMTDEGNEKLWSLRDCVFEIKEEIEAVAMLISLELGEEPDDEPEGRPS